MRCGNVCSEAWADSLALLPLLQPRSDLNQHIAGDWTVTPRPPRRSSRRSRKVSRMPVIFGLAATISSV